MAVVSVTADNFRVDDAEDITGVSSRGGGAGAAAEAPLAYQGTRAWNRKVTSSSGAGFEYSPTSDGGVVVDMTATDRRHWMAKHIVSDFTGLRGNDGLRLYIGDGSNEYGYITAGTDAAKSAYSEYLLRTATVIVPVSPNVVGYRDGTHSGSGVTLTSVDLFGIEAEFSSSTAKSENVALDAIDIGAGLDLVGGDGGDPDGKWSDFVDADQGTTANRWGYANSIYGTSGVLFFFGRMRIGSSGSAAVFTDTGATCLWPDTLGEAGFAQVELDLQNALTVITEGAAHTSLGTTDTEDTRLDYTVTGTAGSATISGAKNNLRNVTLTSAATLNGADIQCAGLTQGAATLTNTIVRCNSASGVAVCSDLDLSKITGLTITQTGSGHFADLGSVTSDISLDWNVISQGFPAGATGDPVTTTSNGDETLLVNVDSGRKLTINVAAGVTAPSVKNDGPGDVAVVVPQVTLSITGQPAGSKVIVHDFDGVSSSLGTELARYDPASTTESYAYPSTKAGDQVSIQLVPTPGTFKRDVRVITLGSTDATFEFNPVSETN